MIVLPTLKADVSFSLGFRSCHITADIRLTTAYFQLICIYFFLTHEGLETNVQVYSR
jgi:hypothetical protein